MRLRDRNRFAIDAIVRYPMRTSMLLLATAIGVASVLLLTSLGEGARRYVTGEFQSIGTHLLIVLPGKLEASGGGIAGALGGSPRDVTLGDVEAIARIPQIDKLSPLVPGQAAASVGRLERDVTIFGVAASAAEIRGYEVGRGRFVPPMDLDESAPVCVVGKLVASELFRNTDPLGEWLELGDARCRVIGVMGDTGVAGGQDVDDTVFVPVAFAMQLFNTESVFRILIQAESSDAIPRVRREIRRTIMDRHYGNDDVTILTQDAILRSFNLIFGAITAALGGIAAISLVVAGTLIMNVMLVAVSQRTSEIGLIKALGARRRQIIGLFLTEAAILSLLGAAAGVLFGELAIEALRNLYPIVDFVAPTWAVVMALIIAVACGLLFGIMPARRAANLDPVQALSGR